MKIVWSRRIFREAKKVMVGGVNSPVRSFLSVGGNPLIVKSGKGAKIYDEDGQGFTDYCLSWGALILGHAHPEVVKAVEKTIKSGSSFGTTTKLEVEMAKFIIRHVPTIEKIRFVNSGTEATMSAIRLARGFTKKDMAVKFDGCYHGHVDDLLIKAGSGVAKLNESSSLGIPANHVQNTVSLPYNDLNALNRFVEQYHKKIACVIIEPVAGNMGTIVPEIRFLKALRELTQKYRIVLIFDEIITGFRMRLGGVQSDLGIFPDLTCLGKIIGGGFPVGAYGGRRDIMNKVAPLGGVYQAGTFSGNPVVMAAGLTTLKNLTASVYRNLNQKAQEFSLSLNEFFRTKRIPASLTNYKSMLSLRFSDKKVSNYKEVMASSSTKIYRGLFHHLLYRNIYFPPAELETFFISGAHSHNDMVHLTKAITDFFKNNSTS